MLRSHHYDLQVHFTRNAEAIGHAASRIDFVPLLMSRASSHHTLLAEVIHGLSSHIAAWLSSLYSNSTPQSKIPPNIERFLQLPWEQGAVKLHSHDPHPMQPSKLVLGDLIGQGLTAQVHHISGSGSAQIPLVAKIMSVRELASVVRETLFYQYVFPASAVARYVPRYYGTYASCGGGWYIILLEHAGQPLQSFEGAFMESDMASIR